MTLRVMEKTRLSDRVAAELRRLVVQGVYPPGSKLPSGQELAQQLGVTRLTLREALQQLETGGMVRTRHGSGTYVVDPAETATLQTLSDTLTAGRDMQPDEMRGLIQFREVVISGFIDAIAAGARAEHADRLDAIVAEERAALGDAPELARLDFRFNETLALASGNVFYKLMLRSVARAHIYLGEIVFSQCGDGSIVVDTHAAIARALRAGDPARLRRRLHTYLSGGNTIVTEWLRKPRRAP
jgi:GntR family transcriptional regulator, transcriptional repressor for pyruvate dehydrogenase complex